jgi:chaperonin GroES
MNINPIRDKILVKPAEAETTTKGGLVIPDTASEGPNRGEVISVGTGKLTDEGTVVNLEVSAGNTVLYPRGAGVKTKVDDTEYLILTEDQILATVSE